MRNGGNPIHSIKPVSLSAFLLFLLLPGVRLNTSPTDYHPIKQLQMLRFDGKSWEVLGGMKTVEGQ